MSAFSNHLSDAETERLALIAEECAEVIMAVGKILRHGYESCHPDGGPTNRGALEEELGHVCYAISLLAQSDDIDKRAVEDSAQIKRRKIGRYLHHQMAPTAENGSRLAFEPPVNAALS